MTIHSTLATAGTLALLLALAPAVAAQDAAPLAPAADAADAPRARTWELRFTSGGLVPTGHLRDAIRNAELSAAQVSWRVRPQLAITGTFGWARSRDLSASGSPKLDVFTSDLGIEATPDRWRMGTRTTLTPFVGAGAGARSYNHRSLDIDATHNLAGYVAAGGEIGFRRVGIRLEARDYVTGFRPVAGAGTSEISNDVVVMVGLRIRR
jgi:hypothetical protein